MGLSESIDTLIVGAGLSGLSTAYYFDGSSIIVEANDCVGGKARSETYNGYTFDLTGHWLHLTNIDIRDMVYDLIGKEQFMTVQRRSRIWSHGVYVNYPFQANLHGLPPPIVKECLLGAVNAAIHRLSGKEQNDEPENFVEWIRYYFGEGIARHFMIPFNEKLWDISTSELTSRWCQRFVPKPNLEEIIAGAVGCGKDSIGYNVNFLYPRSGGIQTLANGLADAVGVEKIFLQKQVTGVDYQNRIVHFKDGQKIRYKRLVSTLPLPLLIDMLHPVPDTVISARKKLRARKVIYLNIGINGDLGRSDHWIYVPEKEWPMYRVGSYSNVNPVMAPDGCSSLYIELSDRSTPLDIILPQIEKGLISMGIIDSEKQIEFVQRRSIPGGYVIYDFNYHESRATIHDWLSSIGVYSIGRYGDWNYSSMEDALLDGLMTAESLAGEAP